MMIEGSKRGQDNTKITGVGNYQFQKNKKNSRVGSYLKRPKISKNECELENTKRLMQIIHISDSISM